MAVGSYLPMKTRSKIKGRQQAWAGNAGCITLLCLGGFVSGSDESFAQGQRTVVFDGHVGAYGTNYYELGMRFRVDIPTFGSGSVGGVSGYPTYDGMAIASIPTAGNIPSNTTPYMAFFQQFSPDDYVSFSLTNGAAFGLKSVSLADANSPSQAPVSITFAGHKSDGSAVSYSFITPGNNANSFLNYTFPSDFSAGLVGVDILASRWAMDNLVFTVPEPGSSSVALLGLLCLLSRRGVRLCFNSMNTESASH